MFYRGRGGGCPSGANDEIVDEQMGGAGRRAVSHPAFMKISDDRISHVAHLIHDGLYHDDLVDYPDEDKAIREIKQALVHYFHVEEEADRIAREKIDTLKRGVSPGSREWEVLYRKYFEEEMAKHGRG